MDDTRLAVEPSPAVDGNELMHPGEVAKLFGVTGRTLRRWASAGRLQPVFTLGGHRRYRRAEVMSLLRIRDEGASFPDDTAPDAGDA